MTTLHDAEFMMVRRRVAWKCGMLYISSNCAQISQVIRRVGVPTHHSPSSYS
jgi:rRNA-processing protein FCF1